MNITEKDREISKLIARELIFGLNEEEKRLLLDWRELSEKNETLYKYLSDYRHIRTYDERLKRIDSEQYWKRMEQVLQPRRHQVHLRRWMTIAAIMVIGLGAGIIGLRILTIDKDPVALVKTEKENSIVPGGVKATLVLAGGKQVELGEVEEKGMEIDGMEIREDRIIVKEKQGEVKRKVEWNKLLIPRGGEYKLVLGDGTVIYVNSESRLEFPVEFSDKERVIYLQGEAYFKVAHDTSQPFIVKTDRMDIRVLGTEFNVKAYQSEEHVQATLVQGHVCVATGREKRQLMDLHPSQQADWDVAMNKLVVREVDVNSVVAWKNGQFIFKGERLEDIMNVLARWYDFEICYQNDRIRNMIFAGKLNRLESIRPILEIIESTDKIHIEIQGKSLILSEK